MNHKWTMVEPWLNHGCTMIEPSMNHQWTITEPWWIHDWTMVEFWILLKNKFFYKYPKKPKILGFSLWGRAFIFIFNLSLNRRFQVTDLPNQPRQGWLGWWYHTRKRVPAGTTNFSQKLKFHIFWLLINGISVLTLWKANLTCFLPLFLIRRIWKRVQWWCANPWGWVAN